MGSPYGYTSVTRPTGSVEDPANRHVCVPKPSPAKVTSDTEQFRILSAPLEERT